jgi:hypothetical protein
MATGGAVQIKFPFEESFRDVQLQLPRFRNIYKLFNGSPSEVEEAKDHSRRLKEEGLLPRFIEYRKAALAFGDQLMAEGEEIATQKADALQRIAAAQEGIARADANLADLKEQKRELFYQHNQRVTGGRPYTNRHTPARAAAPAMGYDDTSTNKKKKSGTCNIL